MNYLDLRNIHPIYKMYWKDIGSQAHTEMKLKEEHYYRRPSNEGVYYCFCGCGHTTEAQNLLYKTINCYNCKKEFVFKDYRFPVRLVCEDCNGKG